MAELLSYLSTGDMVGVPIPIDFGDPRFNDGNWQKMDYGLIVKEREYVGAPYRTQYRMNIHYNFNRVTGEIADIKFTNTVNEGCQGTPVADAGGIEDIYSMGFGYAGYSMDWMYFGGYGGGAIGEVSAGPLRVVGGGCSIFNASACGNPILQ